VGLSHVNTISYYLLVCQLLFAFLIDVKRSGLNLFCNTIVIINFVFDWFFLFPPVTIVSIGILTKDTNMKKKTVKLTKKTLDTCPECGRKKLKDETIVTPERMQLINDVMQHLDDVRLA